MGEPVRAEFDVVCLFCGTVQTVHTNADGDTPSPGDICICYECGYTASYGDDLQLVALSPDQQLYVETNPKFKIMMAALRTIKEREARRYSKGE